jgi:hypothetical protein
VDAVIDIVASILVLFVFVWIAIFGGLGALLSRSRGGSAVSGLAWGVLLGPIGWAVICVRTRRAAREITSSEWIEGSDLDDDWTAALVGPPGGEDNAV